MGGGCPPAPRPKLVFSWAVAGSMGRPGPCGVGGRGPWRGQAGAGFPLSPGGHLWPPPVLPQLGGKQSESSYLVRGKKKQVPRVKNLRGMWET